MSDPYTDQELESLLPPFPAWLPTAEIDTGDQSDRYHQVLLLDSGHVDVTRSDEPYPANGEDLKATIALNIERLRNDRGWKQAQVTRMLGRMTRRHHVLPNDAISKIERGIRSVSAEELVWLAMLYEVPIWELVAPRPDKLVDLYAGRLRDRDGVLATLTHQDPRILDEINQFRFREARRQHAEAQRDAKRQAAITAHEAEHAAMEESPRTTGPAVRVEHSSELVQDTSKSDEEHWEALRKIFAEALAEAQQLEQQKREER